MYIVFLSTEIQVIKMKHETELKKIERELEYLKITKRELQFQDKHHDRKKRTKRLIETGALCEKYFDMYPMTMEDREEVFKIFSNYIQANTPNRFHKKENT
jgi:Cft2 family RNA processing exonuclease